MGQCNAAMKEELWLWGHLIRLVIFRTCLKSAPRAVPFLSASCSASSPSSSVRLRGPVSSERFLTMTPSWPNELLRRRGVSFSDWRGVFRPEGASSASSSSLIRERRREVGTSLSDAIRGDSTLVRSSSERRRLFPLAL